MRYKKGIDIELLYLTLTGVIGNRATTSLGYRFKSYDKGVHAEISCSSGSIYLNRGNEVWDSFTFRWCDIQITPKKQRPNRSILDELKP